MAQHYGTLDERDLQKLFPTETPPLTPGKEWWASFAQVITGKAVGGYYAVQPEGHSPEEVISIAHGLYTTIKYRLARMQKEGMDYKEFVKLTRAGGTVIWYRLPDEKGARKVLPKKAQEVILSVIPRSAHEGIRESPRRIRTVAENPLRQTA